MKVFFSTGVGDYLRKERDHEEEGILYLLKELSRLDSEGEKALNKIPKAQLEDEIYFLSIGDFIVTATKRPNGDFYITDITKGTLPKESFRRIGEGL
ncbi:MAG TPA: hypothetical protein VEK82_05665 [Stellaceae bacterium]|nr:hypothetical protein [Stellaceae bacterium]